MPCFKYGNKEIEALKARDVKLAKAIEEIGLIRRPVTPDLFAALVQSIAGQQISAKAWITVWNRMIQRLGRITPENLAARDLDEIQGCGLTMRKAGYIKQAAEKIVSGEFDLKPLYRLSDDEVCARLSSLNGVGVWTAEMLLIFSMQRPDVLSYGDLAIHRGLRMIYGHRQVDRKLFEKYRRRYSPYATVASLYLWAVAAGACEGLSDPAPKPPKGKTGRTKAA